MQSILLALSCLTILCACGKSKTPLQLPSNAAQLLAGDSSKTWMLAQRYNDGTRVNMGPCYMGFRQTFNIDGTFYDNNSSQEADCGESMRGKWYLRHDSKANPYLSLQSSLIPKAFGIEKDLKDFRLMEFSDEKMVLRFRHTLFTSKATLIEDTYVPEGVVVEGRDFHW